MDGTGGASPEDDEEEEDAKDGAIDAEDGLGDAEDGLDDTSDAADAEVAEGEVAPDTGSALAAPSILAIFFRKAFIPILWLLHTDE